MVYSIASVDLESELVLHGDGSKVPYPRTITAISSGAAVHVNQGFFNPGLTRSLASPRATIRLTFAKTTPAWRNLGECVSFESHYRHVHGVIDPCDVASRAINGRSMRTFRTSFGK